MTMDFRLWLDANIAKMLFRRVQLTPVRVQNSKFGELGSMLEHFRKELF